MFSTKTPACLPSLVGLPADIEISFTEERPGCLGLFPTSVFPMSTLFFSAATFFYARYFLYGSVFFFSPIGPIFVYLTGSIPHFCRYHDHRGIRSSTFNSLKLRARHFFGLDTEQDFFTPALFALPTFIAERGSKTPPWPLGSQNFFPPVEEDRFRSADDLRSVFFRLPMRRSLPLLDRREVETPWVG